MITEMLATLLLAIVFGLFWYIFRGLNYDENPIWGNVLASGFNIVFCGLFAIWFYQGNIVQTDVVVADQYNIMGYLSLPLQDQVNVSTNLYKIGDGGSGMYTVAQVDGHSQITGNYSANTSVIVYHHEIYYTQLQDIALSFVFTALAIISGFLFSWFSWNARILMNEAEAYNRDHPEDEGIT